MSTRTSLASDQRLVNEIASLRTDADSLRVNQRIGGTAMATWISTRSGTWDERIDFTGAGNILVPITFTAAQQNYPFARLTYRLYYGSTSTEIHPKDSTWPFAAIHPGYADPANPKAVTWSLYLLNPSGAATYYVKWWVLASDEGAIS